jgi:hypothetical protein
MPGRAAPRRLSARWRGCRCELVCLAMSASPLKEKLSAVRQSIIEVRTGEKRAQDADRRCRVALQRACNLIDDERRTTLATYVLAEFDVLPAVEYLELRGRQHAWPGRSQAELRTLVVDMFLSTSLGDIDDRAVFDSQPHSVASQMVEEWSLFTWCRRGATPSTDALLVELERHRAMAGHPDPSCRGSVAEGRARMWATRWRRRWGGRYGSLRETDCIPLAEMQQKERGARAYAPLWPVMANPLAQ